ncbi:MAG: right-handed parallel beta-helix repeat-containing protein [Methanosarcinales archaeon]|nr:MAG: right-handed parallel beta-helix repeat-containing protein [Methanosarcinales archaeon]
MAVIYVDIKNTSGVEGGSDAHPYSKIQKGIDAAKAGDTVNVAAGMYEGARVNKPLKLVGENKNSVFIKGTIRIDRTRDVEISEFTIQKGSPFAGIMIANANNNTIKNCIVEDNWYGIYVHFSSNNVVKNNVVKNNQAGGIFLSYSANDNIISYNTLSNHSNAISSVYVPGDSIITRGNTICNNVIQDNLMGVSFYNSEDYKIYHNNFISNTYQTRARGNNIWDNGAGAGNYWSDYTGEDINNDGIGDTKIPHLGVDNYPLMRPFGIDTTPPSPPIIDQPSTPTKTTPITVSGTAEPNSRLQAFVNGVVQGSTSTDASGKFNIGNVNLGEGDNAITAKAIDATGNVSEESQPVTVVLDTVPPSPPTLNPLKPITNKTPITVTGAAEPNSTIEVFVNDISRGITPATTDGSFALEIVLDEGINTITATSTDTTGNTSKPSPPISVFYELFPQEPLADLPIISIEGIGDVFAKELEEHEINTLRDLGAADVPMLADSVEVPLLRLYEAKRKAELALFVKVDGALFEPLLEWPLIQIMETPINELSKVSNQSIDAVNSLKTDISTLLISLDNVMVKNMVLGGLVVGPYPIHIKTELMEKRFEIDERAFVNLTIKNVGSAEAQSVTGTVISELPKLKVLSEALAFGDVPKGATASAKVDLQTLGIEPGKYTLKLVLDAKGVQSIIQNFEVNVVED